MLPYNGVAISLLESRKYRLTNQKPNVVKGLFYLLAREVPLWAIAIHLGYPPKVDRKTLLLKTPYIWVIEHG